MAFCRTSRLGPSLLPRYSITIDIAATAAASLLFADIMFLGVDGIELNQGLTCSHPQEAEVLRMLARHSKHLVVVADSSKIGSVSQWLLCPIASERSNQV